MTQKMKKHQMRFEEYNEWRDTDKRAPHQIERGPRFGNQRKMQAKMKRQAVRTARRVENKFVESFFF